MITDNEPERAEKENVPVPVPESEQIWIVTNINNLGYELNGQRYDLATFQRIDSQDTAQAYCIDLISPTWCSKISPDRWM